jgi:membrane-bound lytic murein transglycosylase D
MNYTLVALTLSMLLFGCQLTSKVAQEHNIIAIDDIESALPEEINQALLIDESIDVIHPVADVDIKLTDNDIMVSDNIWQRIRDQITFSIPEDSRVIAERNWYVNHPSYLDRIAKRAEPFLFYIIEQLEANDIPIEIALLPIVESAYDPFAYSHGRASGMWQFVPETGKRFGMQQNWWYDGRRDVIASTQGAIDYLKFLHKYFNNDWLLALAAYNSGEGRVQRAMKQNARKQKPTDFWSLDLPKETRTYVPKLLALVDIIKRPESFNIELYQLENSSVISTVDIAAQIDLAKAAELADISLAELQRLNPGFNRWATAPEGPHYLVLPNSKIEKFSNELTKIAPEQRLNWQRYKIKAGDSLIKIANQFNTSTALIKQLNNLQSNDIRAGKHLLIPVSSVSLDRYILSQEQRIASKQQKQRSGEKTTYRVKSGDTLWDIGKAFHVSPSSIAKWNGMAPRDMLKPGQKLVIWQKTDFKLADHNQGNIVENAVMRNITYRVRRGDSFARIADKFNVSIGDIERWNQLSRDKYLQPGQILKLSVDVTNNI